MGDADISSGFIDVAQQTGEQLFTELREVYVSSAGYERLFYGRRYGRLHILKTLKPAYAGNPFYEEALHKEFSIGYRLEHPHIVRVLGWETLPDLGHCIVMEYIDGMTLRQFMEQGKQTPELARKFVCELCDALGYLHNKQIVHRDLKPENILITHNGYNVKLIDFGLSDSDDYDILKLPAGTRYYLAPEALTPGQPLDCRADIFSLGVIMGEMAELLKDKQLAVVSRKCTRQKPAQRYVSARAVAQALCAKASYRGRTWLLAAAALLLFVLYIFYRYGVTDERAVSFPVYGNRSMPIEQWGDSAALTGQPQSF